MPWEVVASYLEARFQPTAWSLTLPSLGSHTLFGLRGWVTLTCCHASKIHILISAPRIDRSALCKAKLRGSGKASASSEHANIWNRFNSRWKSLLCFQGASSSWSSTKSSYLLQCGLLEGVAYSMHFSNLSYICFFSESYHTHTGKYPPPLFFPQEGRAVLRKDSHSDMCTAAAAHVGALASIW